MTHGVPALAVTIPGLPDTPTHDEWRRHLHVCMAVKDQALSFHIGDVLNYGDAEGRDWTGQECEQCGIGPYSPTALSQFQWVASRYPPERRDPLVCYTIFREFAEVMDDEARFGFIERARDERWTTREAKRQHDIYNAARTPDAGGGRDEETQPDDGTDDDGGAPTDTVPPDEDELFQQTLLESQWQALRASMCKVLEGYREAHGDTCREDVERLARHFGIVL